MKATSEPLSMSCTDVSMLLWLYDRITSKSFIQFKITQGKWESSATGSSTNDSVFTVKHIQELIIIPFQSTKLTFTCFVILTWSITSAASMQRDELRRTGEEIPCCLIWGSTQEWSGGLRQRLLKLWLAASMHRAVVGRSEEQQRHPTLGLCLLNSNKMSIRKPQLHWI